MNPAHLMRARDGRRQGGRFGGACGAGSRGRGDHGSGAEFEGWITGRPRRSWPNGGGHRVWARAAVTTADFARMACGRSEAKRVKRDKAKIRAKRKDSAQTEPRWTADRPYAKHNSAVDGSVPCMGLRPGCDAGLRNGMGRNEGEQLGSAFNLTAQR